MSFKVSIILCTYNESKYIENTVKNLNNNISDLELVIVDDNSSDGTIDIINKLNKDNRYKTVFRKRSRSLASAFVRGITETSGDYIGWIDTNQSELAPKFNVMVKELRSLAISYKDEKEVEIGIIKKPILLKKLTLNNIFKKTIKEEI